jgi:hypothetical protein
MGVYSLGEMSMGTFTDGPFGLGSGGILTSGKATGAYTSGDRNVDTGIGVGYDGVCAPGTQNINALQVELQLEPGFNGVRIEFVFATQEAPRYRLITLRLNFISLTLYVAPLPIWMLYPSLT